jgi:hypothetical protein
MTVYKLLPEGIYELQSTTFESEGILERISIQKVLRSNIDVVAPAVFIIAEEFGSWEESRRRIDLLGLDKEGNLVVIEIKRTDTGGHMDLQALRYAAMVSTMTFEQAVNTYEQYLENLGEDNDAQAALLEFLGWEEPMPELFAADVKIVLVSADFSKELTTSVMWLNRKGLDIRCVRLKPYRDDGSVYLDVQQVIPLPEAAEYEIRIREQQEEKRESISSGKDYTKYIFKGGIYPKNRLVHAVVDAFIRDHPETTYSGLKDAFPDELNPRYGVFTKASNAISRFQQSGRKRYFIKQDELLQTGDGVEISVCSQWGLPGMPPFLQRARELGYVIDKER